jgi:hypothetical protein
MTKKWVTQEKCTATGVTTENGNCLHHLMSRGSHPELQDEEWNLMPLSFLAHTEVHMIGLERFARKYPGVARFLKKHNWYLCEVTNKWRHE